MQKQEYFVGWFTLSLVIAGIAQGKNRSGLGWWLLGLFFGPLALAILLFLDPAPEFGLMESRLADRIAEEVRKIQRDSGKQA